MRAQLSNRDYEQLSAYLDGQLAPGDKRKLEERLNARPELQVALDELSRTRALIRMAPRQQAPRNFTLTPAMVGDTGPSRKRGRSGFFNLNLFPALSFASMVATLLLVATLFFELGPGTVQQPTLAMEPLPESAQSSGALQRDTMTAETTAPANAAPQIMAEPEGMDQQPGARSATDAGEPAAGAAKAAGEQDEDGPVVVWGSPSGGFNAAPQYPGGMGGGAPDGRGGGGGGAGSYDGVPDGVILIPPQGVENLGTPVAEAPAELQADRNMMEGSGPILGVPSSEERGQILDQSSLGQPAPEAVEQPAGAPEQAETPLEQLQQDRGPLGLTLMRWLQVLLLLISLITAVAAVIVRRKARS